jgi:hypothetical protein
MTMAGEGVKQVLGEVFGQPSHHEAELADSLNCTSNQAQWIAVCWAHCTNGRHRPHVSAWFDGQRSVPSASCPLTVTADRCGLLALSRDGGHVGCFRHKEGAAVPATHTGITVRNVTTRLLPRVPAPAPRLARST